MDQTLLITLLQETITSILVVSAPVLITSLVVGLAISILQAITQIQESTLTFVPKIIVSLGVLVLCAPWLVDHMVTHTAEYFALLIEIAQK